MSHEKDSVRIIALLSLLVKKGLLTSEDVEGVTDIKQALSLIASEADLSEGERQLCVKEIGEIVDGAAALLKNNPAPPGYLNKVEKYRELFPRLFEFLLRDSHAKDPGTHTN